MFDCYESVGDLLELDRLAAELSRQRTAETDARARRGLSNDLATVLWTRYEMTGDLGEIDRAIAELRDAAAGLDRDDPLRLVIISNLGGALLERSTRSGLLDELIEASQHIRFASEATTPDDPRYVDRRARLGSVLLAYYQRTGHSEALHEAHKLLDAAVAPALRARSPAKASNLAECLHSLHLLTGDVAAIEAAVDLARQAATAIQESHVLYARFQANLSRILTSAFAALAGSQTADGRTIPTYLAEALRASRAACAVTPASHPNQPERYTAYGEVLLHIHRVVPEAGVHTELRRVARSAVKVTPSHHTHRSQALMLRARAESLCALARSDATAALAALASFDELMRDEQPVLHRIHAAHRLALFACSAAGKLPGVTIEHAVNAFRFALELLPQAAGREFLLEDREYRLGHFADLARDAAACALIAGQPVLALSFLEQGRGVLLSQTHEMWPDLAESSADREIADELERLRAAPEPSDADPVAAAARRAELAQQWAQLLARTRASSGFAELLRAPSALELAGAGAPGAVAIINVSGLRSDALLVGEGCLQVVPLPQLREDDAEHQAARLLAAVCPGAPRSLARAAADEHVAREVLSWLWHAVVGPVLTAMGHTRDRPPDLLPRLWWIPTGALTTLPLHAAADAPRGANALDRVISSYAPTLRALRRPRAPRSPGGSPQRPLVVAVPDAAAAAALPGALTEARTIAELYPGARLLLGSQASRQAVLDAVSRHDWVHFACHARSVPDDTARGYLVVHDGSVSTRDIARRHLAGAELAFLSACETTRTSARLREEAVHLTGAFYLAGFCQVIGTLWPVPDDLASRVAIEVHTALSRDRLGGFEAARAVHHAAHRIRAEYPDTCTLWAAHVHVGR